MKEGQRPIYVSNMPMPKDEKQYFNLLFDYRDVFAQSYKEMPDLDPKVVVHNLAIRKGISPKISLNGVSVPN